MNTAKRVIATFFFIGYSPVAPGTCASIAAAAIYVAAAYALPSLHFVVIGVLVVCTFAANLWTGDWARRTFGSSDPQVVVVDEALGLFASVFLVGGLPPWAIGLLGLGLFRLFDIAKPFPLRRVEKLPGAWGIALDDLIAGVFSNVILQLGILIFNKSV